MMPSPFSMPQSPSLDACRRPDGSILSVPQAPIANAPVRPPALEPAEKSSAALAVEEAQRCALSKPVKVKVLPRLRVVHEGKPYVGGSTLTVSAAKADHWIKHKFVELVSGSVSQLEPQKGKA